MKRAFDGQPVAAVSRALGYTNIFDLNDDCLRESLKYLKPAELAAVADVCTRFKQITQMHFRTSKYKLLETSTIYEEAGMLGAMKV